MLVAVVQAGSLSAAATRLGTPLPTLSRRIRDLERQLRVQLLERSARGTKLTDASPKLVERFGMPAEPDALLRFPCAVSEHDVTLCPKESAIQSMIVQCWTVRPERTRRMFISN
jgi:Bacterial regulatory helix-turn-helix protein, lysR family